MKIDNFEKYLKKNKWDCINEINRVYHKKPFLLTILDAGTEINSKDEVEERYKIKISESGLTVYLGKVPNLKDFNKLIDLIYI